MSQLYNIYGNLLVNGSATSNSLSSTTITASTFYGAIDAKYIGTGATIGSIPNIVTNQEFTYLSGLTGFAQTQINTKAPIDSPFITYSASNRLQNYKIISGGTNILTGISNTHFSISAKIGALEVGVVTITTSGDSNYSLNNFNPNGLSAATQIIIIPQNVIKISGISGGTSGRYLTITNSGNYPIIFENLGTGSSSSNRFKLTNDESWLLTPNKTINLVYNTTILNWIPVLTLNKRGVDTFDDFYSVTTSRDTNPTSTPQSTPFYYIYGVGSGPSTSTGCRVWQQSCANACIEMARYVSSSASPPLGVGPNPTTRLRVGLRNGFNSYESTSGTGFLMLTLASTVNGGFNVSTDNYAITFGTENNYLVTPYTAATSMNTTLPQFSGGSFWLMDVSGNSQFARYIVQTTGNTSQVQTSSLSLDSFKNNFTTLGVYTIASGNTISGSSTFFWGQRNTSTLSENFTIDPPIIHTGGTINGYPGFNVYSSYNFGGGTLITSSSNAKLDFLAHSVFNGLT